MCPIAQHLVRSLIPEWRHGGLGLSLCEQLVADALEVAPRPRTLQELLIALGTLPPPQDSAAIELLAVLRSRARETPALSLEALLP